MYLKTAILAGLIISGTNSFSQKFGVFDGHTDVGKILHTGSTTYNAAAQTYVLSGSGTNIWFTHDDFQYAWKKLKGDFILQARGKLIGKGVEEHRKFGWMIRKNLDSTSEMIAATIHWRQKTIVLFDIGLPDNHVLDTIHVEEQVVVGTCSVSLSTGNIEAIANRKPFVIEVNTGVKHTIRNQGKVFPGIVSS